MPRSLLCQENMARFMQGIAMPAAQRVVGLRGVENRGQRLLGVRAYQSAAPIQAPASQRAIYTNFAIYKGKGAAAFRVRKPRWVETPDGSGFSLERQGSLIVELAPVAPGSGSNVGARSYSWDRKQTFALSPVELAGVIECCTTGKSMKELFHDPNKGREDDGKISKTLSLQRFDQGGDWFLQLSVQDSANKDGSMKIGLPITGSELFTLKALAEFFIPRFLGYDEVLAEPEIAPAAQGGSLG